MEAKTRRKFDQGTVWGLRETEEVGISAGSGGHRPTGVWIAVVDGEPYVRSWRVTGRSWYHALAADPVATVRLGGEDLPVKAEPVEDPGTRDAVSEAIRRKYEPLWPSYVPPFYEPESLATTTRLVPRPASRGARPRR